jgi:hypothetical protein
MRVACPFTKELVCFDVDNITVVLKLPPKSQHSNNDTQKAQLWNQSTMADPKDDNAAAADDDAADSDVELEGMDIDEEEEEDVGDDVVVEEVVPPTSPAVDKKLEQDERRDLEEAKRERMELIAAESKKIAAPATKQDRLNYLMAQSDVFAHFLAGMLVCSTF